MWEFLRDGLYPYLALVFPYAIAYTVPLLMASLGGLYSERSGVVNIGLEGLMVIGTFACAVVVLATQGVFVGWAMATDDPFLDWLFATSPLVLGMLGAVLAGATFSLLHSFASINLKANQVISGTAINMIAGALTVFLSRSITGSGNVRIDMGFLQTDVPGLSSIPGLGPLLFGKSYATTWIAFALLALGWFVMYKTPFGLRLRACGEHPQAADAAGVNVYKMRYIAVTISGGLAGFAGSAIILTYSGEFNGSVSGLGFLALAALIFGQWKPLGILGATLFFGFAATVANISQVVPAFSQIPGLALKAFPYVLTLLALIAFSKSSQAPRASGEPFEKGKR